MKVIKLAGIDALSQSIVSELNETLSDMDMDLKDEFVEAANIEVGDGHTVTWVDTESDGYWFLDGKALDDVTYLDKGDEILEALAEAYPDRDW
jgi:hypothetical protein